MVCKTKKAIYRERRGEREREEGIEEEKRSKESETLTLLNKPERSIHSELLISDQQKRERSSNTHEDKDKYSDEKTVIHTSRQ